MFYLHVCMCVTCVPGIQGSKKRALGPLELDLWMIVSHHVDAGNQTQVIRKINISHQSTSAVPRDMAIVTFYVTPKQNFSFAILTKEQMILKI